MKERFGQKTGSICLESGESVSAVLQIPGLFRVREVPVSIPRQGPLHTKDV